MSNLRLLPACDILGFSLDFTKTSPLDIKSVLAAVKKAHRVINYKPDENTTKVDVVKGVTFDVPRFIGITEYNSSDGNYVTFKSGEDASSTLKGDATLSARYMAVSGTASASYSIDKSYRKEEQWAMYSFNADTYLASLKEYAGLLTEDALARRLEEAKPIGDGNDNSIVQDWKDFFEAWGSHVIINAAYGARFQLTVWASNSDSTVNEKFSAIVTAAFDGVGSGGKGEVDVSLQKDATYNAFRAKMQKLVSVVGGDPVINKKLSADPAHNDVFKQWAETVAEDLSCTNLNVIELWALMRDASRKDVRHAAGMVGDAFHYITTHPQPYQTAILLDIQSDWAEFNLLSPEAVIVPDGKNPFPADRTVATNTRVRWGEEHSYKYERKTLSFYIINDGSPIDFSISRGSNGSQTGKGEAEVVIKGETYANKPKADQDNGWNTEHFYKKPVSSEPAATKINLSEKREWGALLKEYLKEIGAGEWV